MSGEGVVVSLSGDSATVRICKSSACSHDCASCGACQNPTFDTTVKNPIGAMVGDKVVISSDSKKILLISLIMYVLPVILLIIGAAGCESFNVSPVWTIFTFAMIIGIWFVLIRTLNKRAHTEHTITEVIKD